MPAAHHVSRQILQLLNPEVVHRLHQRINYFGHLRDQVETQELEQYFRIAAWKALLHNPNLGESTPQQIAVQIYTKLVSLVLNTGRDGLGAGVRRKGHQFKRRMLPLTIDIPLATTEPLDQVAQELALADLKQALVHRKLTKKTLQSPLIRTLLQETAVTLESPRAALRLLQIALYDLSN